MASAAGAVVMAGAAAAGDGCDESSQFICFDLRPQLITLSLILAVSAVVMWKRADIRDEEAALDATTPPAPPPPVPTAVRTPEDTRAIAELTALMREAAHRPDCVQVQTIGRRLHEIDPDSQTGAMTSDPAIAACFTATP